MKKPNFSSDVKTWLEFAVYDLKSAQWQFEGQIYTSACYAAQQAGEKALKALILSKGQIIPKIHSLDRLISYLKELKTETAEIEDEARELDEFYLTTRYPGQYGGPEGMYSKEEATKAIAAAEEILRFVKQEVKI